MTPTRECATCGVLAEQAAGPCEVCGGELFQTRYRCDECGHVGDDPECAPCAAEPTPKEQPDSAPTPVGRADPRGDARWVTRGAAIGLMMGLLFQFLAEQMPEEQLQMCVALVGAGIGISGGVMLISGTRSLSLAAALSPLWMGCLCCTGGSLLLILAEAVTWVLTGVIVGGVLGYLSRDVIHWWREP